MIPWVRFYPEPISLHPGASYVVDCLPKRPVYQDRYGEALDDAFRTFGGFVCVEWDIALDRDDVAQLEQCIESDPASIWVAPYTLTGGGRSCRTIRGLGCTWLPEAFLSRVRGLREVRYPQADGEIFRQAEAEGWRIREAPVWVCHVHW